MHALPFVWRHPRPFYKVVDTCAAAQVSVVVIDVIGGREPQGSGHRATTSGARQHVLIVIELRKFGHRQQRCRNTVMARPKILWQPKNIVATQKYFGSPKIFRQPKILWQPKNIVAAQKYCGSPKIFRQPKNISAAQSVRNARARALGILPVSALIG